jgi:phage tail protein X
MAVVGHELLTVAGAYVTADLLVWRRYRTSAPGIVERLLDDNPHLAKLHRESPFLPVGTELRIPIDPEILGGRPRPVEFVTLYGRSRA